MRRKMLCLLLIMVLCTMILPLTVDAAYTSGVWEYTISEGDAIITAYNGTSTQVTIPSTLDGYKVTGIGDDLFSGNTSLTYVGLPSTLESIGAYAFNGCTKLTSITLPAKLESLGNGTFFGCTKLTSITLPENLRNVGYHAFYNCKALSKITVKSQKLNDFKTGTNSGSIYGTYGGVFEYAGKDAPNGITVIFAEGVTRIPANMFYPYYTDGYVRVKSVSIPSSVEVVGASAFSECYDLTSVTIAAGSLLETIGDSAFCNCTALSSIALPENLRNVGYHTFRNCQALSQIIVKSKNLNDFKTGTNSGSIYGTYGGVFEYAGKDAPNGITVIFAEGVTRIPANMFYPYYTDGYVRVKSVSIPSSVEVVGVSAFSECYDLTSVTLATGSLLETIGDSAFCNCSALSSITLPESLRNVGYHAFRNCQALSQIIVKSKNLNNFKTGTNSGSIYGTYGGVFEYAGEDAPDGITVIFAEGVTRIPDNMFNPYYSDGYVRVKSVSIPSSVEVIGDSAFSECYDLTSVSITSGSVMEYIGEGSFQNCTSLISIVIPEKVEVIYGDAFRDCTSLTSVVFSEKLNTIKSRAFYNCKSLTEFVFTGNAPSIASDTFPGVTATAYYPKGNSTWTSSARKNYGGTLTWKAKTLENGWVSENNVWYYYKNGIKQTGWKQISGSWYYFSNGGAMQTGWQKIDSKWYYFSASGAMQSGWLKDNGVWYYLANDMKTGWQKIDSKWYYFSTGGAMLSGWQKVNGVWYYLANDMKTGWQRIDSKWYYFSASGAMQSGWLKDNGIWYYLGNDMKTGWQKIDSKWYYFSAGGAMQTGWQKLNGSWYYLGTNGVMVTGTHVIDGKQYTFSAGGVMQ